LWPKAVAGRSEKWEKLFDGYRREQILRACLAADGAILDMMNRKLGVLV